MFPDSRYPEIWNPGNIGRANLEIWKSRLCKSGIWIPEIPDSTDLQALCFQICTTYVSGFQVSRFQISRNLESGNIGRANLEIWKSGIWKSRLCKSGIWNLDSRDSRFQISRFAGPMFPDSRFPDLHDLCFRIPGFQISRNLEPGNIGLANLESGNLGLANLEICNLESLEA